MSEADTFIVSMLVLILKLSGVSWRKAALCLLSAEEPAGGLRPPAGMTGMWMVHNQSATLATFAQTHLEKRRGAWR